MQTRRGVPFKMSDLENVSAARASTILLLHPDKVGGTILIRSWGVRVMRFTSNRAAIACHIASGCCGAQVERTGSDEALKAATAMSLVAIRCQASRIIVQYPGGGCCGGNSLEGLLRC